MFSDKQITKIATKLNKEIDIPILTEGIEQALLEQAIKQVDMIILKQIPAPLKGIWTRLADGITVEEAKEISETLVIILNKKINIPMLSEGQEGRLFTSIIEVAMEVLAEEVINPIIDHIVEDEPLVLVPSLGEPEEEEPVVMQATETPEIEEAPMSVDLWKPEPTRGAVEEDIPKAETEVKPKAPAKKKATKKATSKKATKKSK